MERNMMLTPDEYLALRRIITSERESEGASLATPTKSSKKARKDPKLSRAVKAANARAKLKSGKFRKGWNQKRLMTYAHKLKRGYK